MPTRELYPKFRPDTVLPLCDGVLLRTELGNWLDHSRAVAGGVVTCARDDCAPNAALPARLGSGSLFRVAARFDSELSDRSRGYGGTGTFRYV